jgi:hypothetical protein
MEDCKSILELFWNIARIAKDKDSEVSTTSQCIICNEASSKHPPLRESAHDRHADQGVDASVAVAMTTATDSPLCVFS